MRHNVRLLFVVCVGYGLTKGVTDFAVPLYLKAKGHSFRDIGTIFTIAAVAIFFLRIYLARLSDLLGRKLLYVGALALTSLSYLGFPFMERLAAMAALKAASDLSFGVRETMHATALYESRAHGYLHLQGMTRGTEMLFMGLGTLAAGFLIVACGYTLPFAASCGVLLVTTAAFAGWFAEPAGAAAPEGPPLGLLRLLTTAFPRPILVITVSGFIFGVAISASHHYLPPLFFQAKFGLGERAIAWIQLAHLLSHVPALFIVGLLVKRRWKAVFFWTLLVEGILLGLVGCFGALGPTLVFWWTHDIIGAGLWAPIQWALIQHYARRDSRGLDASVVPAVTALGCIFGPLIAGYLAELRGLPALGIAASAEGQAVSLPMIASGAMMVVSALPLLLLPPDRERERA
ncbi:MAG: MFS transporter [Planctomycetes bacterium]|nr:MFS transporter [Planctomycetota bacterium]